MSNPFGFSSHDVGFATDRDDGAPPDGVRLPPRDRKRQAWNKPASSAGEESALEVELTMNPLSRVPDGGHRDGDIHRRLEELAQQFAIMSNTVERLAMAADMDSAHVRVDDDVDDSKSSSRSRSHSLSVRLPPKPILSGLDLATASDREMLGQPTRTPLVLSWQPSTSEETPHLPTRSSSSGAAAACAHALWREVLTADGADVYYFNDETEESLWDPPNDLILLLDGTSRAYAHACRFRIRSIAIMNSNMTSHDY
jgi:hypothetical protein